MFGSYVNNLKRLRGEPTTLFCAFLSCLMINRLSLSFALASRNLPTTSEVSLIHVLIALSLLKWASISWKRHLGHSKPTYTHTHYQVSPHASKHTIWLSLEWCVLIILCTEQQTYRLVELFARLLGVHFAWEGHRGHCGVESVDNPVIEGTHCF